MLFGETKSLVGILTTPGKAASNADTTNLPAVILLNAGIIHRVGPHRLYVKMARRLAAMGFVVLRFDFSGVGDSKVRHDNLTFERSTISEAQDAMNYLSAERGISRFVLAGICSGADVSLKTACCDPRVVGAVLINAQGDQLDTGDELRSYVLIRQKARHVWRSALLNPKMWMRAVTGKVDYGDIIKVLVFPLRSRFGWKKRMSTGTSQYAADLRSVTQDGVRLLLAFSEGDTGLEILREVFGTELQQLRASGKIGFHVIPQADHVFTLLGNQERLLALVHDWAHEGFVNAERPVAEDNRLIMPKGSLGGLAERPEAGLRRAKGGSGDQEVARGMVPASGGARPREQ